MNVNILGLCVARLGGAGKMYSNDYRMNYSGGNKHERGVGIMLNNERAKTVKGYMTISDRVLLVRLKGKPININIIKVYAPTADSAEEESDNVYEDLNKAMIQFKISEVAILVGDFNAKVGDERERSAEAPSAASTPPPAATPALSEAARDDTAPLAPDDEASSEEQ